MKKFLNILSTVLLVLLIALAAVVAGPLAFGVKELAVLSGSMEPGIPVGSLIYVDDSVKAAELKPDDVVTYYLDSTTYVTHRVVSVDTASETLVTKGDANESDDGDVNFSQVFGRMVFHLPFLGYISMYIHEPLGIMVVTALVIVVILLNFLPAIFSGKGDKKLKKDDKV